MAEIWFYTPHNVMGRIVATFTRGEYAHVSIMHSVADLTVSTEASTIKGVWCSPVSRVKKPQRRVSVNVDDAWTTRWLVNKWGVQYGWIDALAFAVPSYQRELDRKGVICTELVGLFLLDAAQDVLSGATIPELWVARLRGAFLPRLSPTELSSILV